MLQGIFKPNPIGGGGFHSPVVFDLPFPRTTSDQPETFPLLFILWIHNLAKNNFHRIPGKSHDRSFVRSTSTETNVLHRNL